MNDSRWFGVGRSAATDSRAAGAEAVRLAVQGVDPKLLVVFCSDSHDPEALLAGVGQAHAGVPLIGCSTAGEIDGDGPGDEGVVVSAFGGEGFSAATAVGPSASADLRAAGSAAAGCIDELGGGSHRVLILLTDGLAGDQQEIVRGAYSVVGAGVPLVGGCAGDDLRMESTTQMHGDRVLSGAVVAAALGSDAPLGIGVRHGWRRVGEPMLITGSEGTTVRTIDERPALDVYLERLQAPAEAHEDAAALTRFAQTHPLGLTSRHGEPHVRFIGEADFERRALIAIASVPQGARAWLMEGDAGSVLEATDGACDDALGALDGHEPLGVLTFDCIARRGVLGEDGIHAEVERVAHKAGGMPVAGFYTYGEIARTSGVQGFHNQTLVVLAVA